MLFRKNKHNTSLAKSDLRAFQLDLVHDSVRSYYKSDLLSSCLKNKVRAFLYYYRKRKRDLWVCFKLTGSAVIYISLYSFTF